MSDNPTCAKFLQVLVNIIKDNLDFKNSLAALQLWQDYLKHDKVLKNSFKPNYQALQMMNLKQYLGEDPNDTGLYPRSDFFSEDNQIVFNFCCLILETYAESCHLNASSFFRDLQSQNDLEHYRQKFWRSSSVVRSSSLNYVGQEPSFQHREKQPSPRSQRSGHQLGEGIFRREPLKINNRISSLNPAMQYNTILNKPPLSTRHDLGGYQTDQLGRFNQFAKEEGYRPAQSYDHDAFHGLQHDLHVPSLKRDELIMGGSMYNMNTYHGGMNERMLPADGNEK